MSNLNFCKMEPNDIWSESDISRTQKEYSKIQTLGEFKKYTQTCDQRLAAQANSFGPVKFSTLDFPINLDNFTFAKIANVQTLNIKTLYDQVVNQCQGITVENSVYTEDRQVVRNNFIEEQDIVQKKGLNKRPHILKVDKTNFSDVHEWAKIFEFDTYYTQIRYAPPGSIHAVHTDSLDGIWEDTQSVNDRKFNHITKTPDGIYAIRILIALNDWTPGQIVGFEDKMWTYRSGDVVAFEWANAKHYTANASWIPRAVLRITGTTTNRNHWIFQNINNKTITDL